MNPRDIAPEIAAVAGKYNYKKPPELLLILQQWIDKAQSWLADFLAALHLQAPGIADTSIVGNVLQVLVIAVGALCLCAIVWVALRRMSQLRAQSELAKRGQTSTYKLLDAAGWKVEASRLAAKGDWREACRAAYMAALRALHENGITEFAPTRTNYEYWYVLSPRSEKLAKEFRTLANQVELVWFGNKAAAESDYEVCNVQMNKVEQECAVLRETKAKEIASKP
ncbi:MAG TPA: DUF4129 domain-containing protein [Drouetiella sp.]